MGFAEDGRAGIDAALVGRLIAEQFPQWQQLPIRPVPVHGWDNRSYRLGDELTVRLPTHAMYVPAVEKERRWLPVLAPQLPLPIPVPVAVGRPGPGYPFAWSVRRWLDGAPATPGRIDDLSRFATALAEFLLALQAIDPADGPPAGAHCFFRGASLTQYDEETRQTLATLAARPDAGGIDLAGAAATWQAALAAQWHGRPVWFHGDVAAGNLLVRDGRLAAVIDFGTCGVGDPACDLVIAWTLLGGPSRQAFRAAIGQDQACWARARGWVLWKSLICLAAGLERDSAEDNRRIIAEVIAEHRAGD